MARPGITAEEVAAAINSIIAGGEEPTIQRIRDHLGTGSPNTIHRHLAAWRAARPVEQRKVPELPADLQTALTKEIERQAAEARAAVEKELVAAQAEAATLAKEGEALEGLNAELAERNAELAADSERLAALADASQDEVKTLKADLDRERKSAEEARIQLAQARNKIETLEEGQVADKAALSEALSAAKTAHAAQVEAEKTAAVAQQRATDQADTLADCKAALAELKAESKAALAESKTIIEEQREELRALRKAASEAEKRVAEMLAERNGRAQE